MMKVLYTLLCVLFLNVAAIAQIRTNQPVGGNISSSSAFLDASSSSTWNNSTNYNLGRGLLFPRVDLTRFSSMAYAGSILPNNYPSRFDGMVVYNSVTGIAAIGGTAVTPGFYYYSNQSTTNVNAGTWVRLLDTNGATSSASAYFGTLETNTPTVGDITALTTGTIEGGAYVGNLVFNVSTAGYFTFVVPASWRNPLLWIDGEETMNVIHPVKLVVIGDVSYLVWQTDISLPSGKVVTVN
ncbi:MAG: hypothetical protein K0M50_03425 [Prolixibacteraceae bacterium]|nr:hypothetical protein [Prolixibacteraceae bacterium]